MMNGWAGLGSVRTIRTERLEETRPKDITEHGQVGMDLGLTAEKFGKGFGVSAYKARTKQRSLRARTQT